MTTKGVVKGTIYSVTSRKENGRVIHACPPATWSSGAFCIRFSPVNVSDGKFYGFNHAACRDILISGMMDLITNPDSSAVHTYGQTLATDKMRMLTITNEGSYDHEEFFNRGLNMLRAFEKHLGWPLTRPYTAIFEENNFENSTSARLNVSSRRWIKAPALVSLYCLLQRMCKDKQFTDVNTVDDVFKIIKDVHGKNHSFVRDDSWIRETSPNWLKLLENYSDLFRKRKISSYWSAYDSYAGISEIFKYKWDQHDEVKQVFLEKGWKCR